MKRLANFEEKAAKKQVIDLELEKPPVMLRVKAPVLRQEQTNIVNAHNLLGGEISQGKIINSGWVGVQIIIKICEENGINYRENAYAHWESQHNNYISWLKQSEAVGVNLGLNKYALRPAINSQEKYGMTMAIFNIITGKALLLKELVEQFPDFEKSDLRATAFSLVSFIKKNHKYIGDAFKFSDDIGINAKVPTVIQLPVNVHEDTMLSEIVSLTSTASYIYKSVKALAELAKNAHARIQNNTEERTKYEQIIEINSILAYDKFMLISHSIQCLNNFKLSMTDDYKAKHSNVFRIFEEEAKNIIQNEKQIWDISLRMANTTHINVDYIDNPSTFVNLDKSPINNLLDYNYRGHARAIYLERIFVYLRMFYDESGGFPKDLFIEILIPTEDFSRYRVQFMIKFDISGKPNTEQEKLSMISSLASKILRQIIAKKLVDSGQGHIPIVKLDINIGQYKFNGGLIKSYVLSSSFPRPARKNIEVDNAAFATAKVNEIHDCNEECEKNNKHCICCEENFASVKVLPCEHVGYCAKCFESYVAGVNGSAPQNCPYCRQGIDSIEFVGH